MKKDRLYDILKNQLKAVLSHFGALSDHSGLVAGGLEQGGWGLGRVCKGLGGSTTSLFSQQSDSIRGFVHPSIGWSVTLLLFGLLKERLMAAYPYIRGYLTCLLKSESQSA